MEHSTTMMQQHQADTLTIDALLSALYATISGPAGERDWARLRNLFMPHATLASVTPTDPSRASLSVRSVGEFAAKNDPYMRSHDFYESEIGRRVERFGNIAHVFSTYEVRASDEPVFARGINSFQLFWDGERWWISNLLWETERLGAMLPDVYLERTGAAKVG